jgi:hypothetical protein
MVDDALVSIQKGIPMLDGKGKLVLPCRVCGRGFYQEHNSVQLKANDSQNRGAPPILIRMFVCNVCTHYEFFAPNFPEETAAKNWKAWRGN